MPIRTNAPLLALLSSLYCWGGDPVYTIKTTAGGASLGDVGQATAAVLTTVQGVALDALGNLYVSDTDAHRVRRVGPDGVIRAFAGTGVPGLSGDGGPADRAQLRSPYGIAFDWRGNFYIADLGNARIRKVTPDGIISTIAGGGAATPADGIQATSAKFAALRNVVVDGELAVLFSDFSGHRIYRVNSSGWLTIVAGNGQAGASPDGISARQSFLAFPTALALDPFGGLYICDSQNRTVKRLQNDLMRTVAQAAAPTGLSFDSAGNLYVADAGGGQVLRVQPSGAVGGLQTVARDVAALPNGVLYLAQGNLIQRRSTAGVLTVAAGGGDPAAGDNGPATDARLRHPAGLARDGNGNLYVADQANNRIRRVAPDGVITTLAVTNLSGPSSVAIDRSGVLYIADTDNHRIQQVSIDARGVASAVTVVGTGAAGFSGDGGAGMRAQLSSPGYVAIAPDGSLYLADTGNGRIRQFRNGGIRTVASNLRQPRGMAFDAAGNLYVATADSRLIRVAPDGAVAPWPPEEASLNAARGVAVDSNGDVLVADTGNHRIRRITADNRTPSVNGRVLTIAGLTTPSFSGDDGPALDAQFNAPFDILAGPDDTMWIADFENNRIRGMTPGVQGPAFLEVRTLAVVNAANLAPGPISPGVLLALPGLAADAVVTVNGAAVEVLRGASSWIVAPMELTADTAVIEARNSSGGLLGRATFPVVAVTPAIFTQADGTQAAALNADGTPNSQSNGAFRTSIVTLYATGLGRLDGSGKPVAGVSVTIRGLDAEVVYSGPAQGSTAVFQINVRVPNGFYSPGAAAVVLSAGEVASPPATISIL